MGKKIRHILGLSGGKDSTALVILLHKHIPNLEFFFCDTHKELNETYEYLEKIKSRLGIHIEYLSADKGFDEFFEEYGKMLPSPQVRWCTNHLKIKPLEKYIGDDETYTYVGIRADEDRLGYVSTKPNIKPVFPYKPAEFVNQKSGYSQIDVTQELKGLGVNLPVKEDGYKLDDVNSILNESGIGRPKYYSWRSRSGCYFCFFQRRYEWVMLAEKHPDLFEKAAAYEENHSDGRKFYWSQGESLRDLLERKDEIKERHKIDIENKKKKLSDRPLAELSELVLDDEVGDPPCIICNL